MFHLKLAIFLALFAIPLTTIEVFAQAPQFCFEDVNDMCGLLSNDPSAIFDGILTPLETQIADFALVIFWGGLLGIIWFKTENIMLLGIVGIIVSATITGLDETSQGIGWLLLGVSIGILSFQLIRQRVSIFS